MRNRRFAVGAVAVLAAVAHADTVSLPFQQPDSGGNSQWMIFYNGNLQQQGNQPVFGQAGMITVNGVQAQRNSPQAQFDEKTKELTVAFTGRGQTGYTQTRRIQFSETGPLRVLDTFENSTDREQTLGVSLMTNVNSGVNDSQLLSEPKKKDDTLGWLANTGFDRAALSLFAGRGTKVAPKVRYQPTNNNVTAQFSLKLPPRGRAVLVHWHGTFDNADAGTKWYADFKESKAIADLPADLRKDIVNLAPSGGGLAGGVELLRGTPTADVVELRGGDVLRGDLKPTAYILATAYGDVTVPADKVAGLVSVGDDRPRQLLVTAEGEMFGGTLKDATLPITLSGGQTTQVPMTQVRRVGYRTPVGDPPEVKPADAMAFLASGERVRVGVPDEPVELITRYGPVRLTPAQISTVLLSPTAPAQTVYLSDGSRLSGVLTAAAFALKLPSTADADKPVTFPLATLARVQFKPLAEGVGGGLPTLGLLGDDLVSARIEQPLTLTTAFDTLTIHGPEIAALARPQPGQRDVQVTTFDGSTFRGTPDAATLQITLAAGPTLTVPMAAVRDYQNPRPYPATGVVGQAKADVAKLGGDDWKEREVAEQHLTAFGPSIVPVLEAALPGQPPEAQERITAILKKLKKDQPTPPTRLTPPPAME